MIDDFWVSKTLSESSGLVVPTIDYVNTTMVLSKRRMLELIRAVTMPSFITTLTTFFKDPSNAISSVKMFPFAIPTSSLCNIKYLGTTLADEDGYGYKAKSIDPAFFSSLTLLFDRIINTNQQVGRQWYTLNGMTKIYMYLPYYGEVDLQPNDVMGRQIRVYYSISVTGDLMYYITRLDYLDLQADFREVLIGKYSTNVAIDIPVGSTNLHAINRDLIIKGLETTVAIAGAVAMGVSGGVTSTSASTSTTMSHATSSKIVKGKSLRKGSRMKVIRDEQGVRDSSTIQSGSRTVSIPAAKQVIDAAQTVANNSIDALNNFFVRGSSENTKNINLEQFGPHRVCVSIYFPVLSEDNHKHFVGLPYNKEGVVGDFSGFTKLSSFRLEQFSDLDPLPTLQEIEMLEEILSSGFIIRAVETTESLDA